MKKILLFDVDGTLTEPRKKITSTMKDILFDIKKKGEYNIGVVGGSDLVKIKEQLGDDIFDLFDYVFSENGLCSFKEREQIHCQNLAEYVGEDMLTKYINYTLNLLSTIDIPKRGTFIEYRNGMLNVSPIGRNCSQKERDNFEKFDKENNIRKNLIDNLSSNFPEYNFQYSIGGQISFDVFPKGWNKTYCLQFLEEFAEIYFFGDKTYPGGNDYEIFVHPKTIGYHVDSWNDTASYLRKL